MIGLDRTRLRSALLYCVKTQCVSTLAEHCELFLLQEHFDTSHTMDAIIPIFSRK